MIGKTHRLATPSATRPSLSRLFAGFVVWALAFVVLYAGHALACLYVSPDTSGADIARWTLIMLWLAHVLLLARMSWRSLAALAPAHADADEARANARFMWHVTFMLDVFACAATIVTGLPLAWVKVCGA
ncbi:hypothetical protein ACSBPU_21450 [Parapusillimonas sp. JC17]|uniref:hypothetical protein n=1 Tax=Parapusillimonas sp. JC17 TaxID=3445768 RepID=UPI003FA152B9